MLKVDKVQENYEKIKIGGEELGMYSPSFLWKLRYQLMEIRVFHNLEILELRLLHLTSVDPPWYKHLVKILASGDNV